jgi:hypothetical protein
MREHAWHKKGTIPGSVNIPFTLFDLDENDKNFIKTMKQLGVKRKKSSGDNTFWSWGVR